MGGEALPPLYLIFFIGTMYWFWKNVLIFVNNIGKVQHSNIVSRIHLGPRLGYYILPNLGKKFYMNRTNIFFLRMGHQLFSKLGQTLTLVLTLP